MNVTGIKTRLFSRGQAIMGTPGNAAAAMSSWPRRKAPSAAGRCG